MPESFYKKNMLFDITKNIEHLKNIYIMHGKSDETVPYKNAEKIYEMVRKPKALKIFENGDHKLSNEEDQKVFSAETINWFVKFLKA